METTPNLALAHADPARAQPHVPYNEALRRLDAIVQLAVLDRDLTAPPSSPAAGARYIVGASATGAWAGRDNQVAAWQDGAWHFYAPQVGWLAWIADEGAVFGWSGSAWVAAGGSTSLNPAAGGLVGVNATADATNRLAVASAASLFNHAGAGHQMKINKAADTDTASQLFQTGFSGRAEFGLTGDDDFHVKVSADGATWFEALVADRATGRVSFPSGGVRDQLTANRQYYVRTDGDDANSGLVNDSGGAFLTIQRAIDVVFGTLDLGEFNATINVAAGIYAENLIVSAPPVGSGKVYLWGDLVTPSNVVIDASTHCLNVFNNGALDLRGFRLSPGASANRNCIQIAFGTVFFGNVEFEAATGSHVSVVGGGLAQSVDDYTINGGALRHFSASRGAQITSQASTITLNGTPAFVDYAYCEMASRVLATASTFVGTATGRRYRALLNGVIKAGGDPYFPGDVAGTVATGGQYE